ncbi:MAG: hypothetical protein ACOZNI_16420 [Myxococcota bacterium]
MDHRCLYGHRVPASFGFAIQNRTCPICGAPTVTVNGYQAARKVAAEAGIEAVAAFNAVRVIETDWLILAPGAALAAEPAQQQPTLAALAPPADDAAVEASPAGAPSVGAPAPHVDEEVVVDDETDVPSAGASVAIPTTSAAPEPRLKPPVRSAKKDEPRKEIPSAAPGRDAEKPPGFDSAEEDFFKGA